MCFNQFRHSHSTFLILFLFLLSLSSPLLIPSRNVFMPVFGINSLHRKRISTPAIYLERTRGSIKRRRNPLNLERVGYCGFGIARGFKVVIARFQDTRDTTTMPPIISEEIILRAIASRISTIFIFIGTCRLLLLLQKERKNNII